MAKYHAWLAMPANLLQAVAKLKVEGGQKALTDATGTLQYPNDPIVQDL